MIRSMELRLNVQYKDYGLECERNNTTYDTYMGRAVETE